MRFIYIRLILFTGLMGFLLPIHAQDITTGLDAWYKFDYQPGDTYIKDYSGNSRHIGAIKAGQQQAFGTDFQWNVEQVKGNNMSTVYFPTGRDGGVMLSNAAGNSWLGAAGSAARTFCAWVKIDAGSDDNTGRILFAYGDDSQPGGRFEIDLKGHQIEFENAANTGGNGWKNRSIAALNNTDHPQGQWLHLALVYDGIGDRKTGVKLYVNGKSLPLTPVNNNADFSISTVTQYAPEIGNFMVKMAIADMRVYNRALTKADINVLCPDDTPVDPPFSNARLRALINEAMENHATTITIPPGTYTGTVPGNEFISINGVNNLKIIADGVTMVCGTKKRAVSISDCNNVTLQGLKIDYNPLTFTQGDIIATGTGYVDIKIHKGYEVKAYNRIDIVDPATRFRKKGNVFLWGSTAAVIGDSIVRVSQSALPGIAVVGDMASLSTANESGSENAIVLGENRGGIKLQKVTVYAAPGFGIFEVGGAGGTILDSCKVVPGPLPAGAVQERLLSASWDAIQHKLMRVGPTVEHCEVKDAGDDTWSVTWDGEYVVNSVSGSTLGLSRSTLVVGDTLRSTVNTDFAVVTGKTGSNVTLDRASPWAVGAKLYSLDRRCEHFVLRGNNFRSSGRVLIKAGHGIIENNIIDTGHSGVTVNTEIGAGLSRISNLIIKNNIIRSTGFFNPAPWSNQAGSISIVDGAGYDLSPAGVFDQIVIEGNTLEDINGVNLVVSSASNVSIKENKFYRTGLTVPNGTGAQYSIGQNTVAYLKNLKNIVLDSNEVIDQGLTKLMDSAKLENFSKLRRGIFIRSEQLMAVSLSVTAPSANLKFKAGADIPLEANVTSNVQISKVEFFKGADKLGEVTKAPYIFNWMKVAKGSYQVTAKAIGEDQVTAVSQQISISVADQPVLESMDKPALNPRNLLSPNGDGKNDYWEIENIAQYPELKVTVFNRQGQQILSAKSFERWDGTVNGSPAPTGLYFYSISENDRTIKTGSITLIR
ncbi:gliding motility-associated-like protein [Flavobacterium sp. W4I14]|nr:gliding motility-associated-like protein [Flavobacterium sp. W4I14]